MTFFHKLASNHKMRNTIDSVMNDHNIKLTKMKEIGSWASSYFKNSYKEEYKSFNREDRKWLIDSMPNVILAEKNEELTQQVTKEEVRRVVFSMKAYKSLGLDGFPPTFFQHF